MYFNAISLNGIFTQTTEYKYMIEILHNRLDTVYN